MHRSALAVALALSASGCGCGGDHTRMWKDVTLADGGYALVEVEVPHQHDGVIRFSFEGAAEGESFAVFEERSVPPFHTGWFDMSPWMKNCERDPATSACLDVHSQNAGVFVGVTRRQLSVPEVVVERECTSKRSHCIYYYAIVAGERGPDRKVRVVVDATTGYNAHAARIEQIR